MSKHLLCNDQNRVLPNEQSKQLTQLDRQPDVSVGNNFTEKAKQIVREDGNGTAEIGEASQESVRLALLWQLLFVNPA